MAKTGQGWAVVGVSALSLLVAGGVGARAIAVEGVGAWARQPVDPTGEPKQPGPVTDELAKPVEPQETAEQARDARLEKQIETRFDRNPTLKAQGLDVTVMQGKVTLTGTTATAKEKAAAERLAKVKGVSEVDNQIMVRGSPEAAQPAGERTRPRATTPPASNPNDTNTGRPGERGQQREKDGRDYGDQTGRSERPVPTVPPTPAPRSERAPMDQPPPARGHGVPAPGGPTPPVPHPPVVPTPIDPMPPAPSEPAAPTAPAPTPLP
jgi:hypothetical protein